MALSFFTALDQDSAPSSRASLGAQVLVGIHVILSARWASVLFAAVMSFMSPKLDRIAKRSLRDDD